MLVAPATLSVCAQGPVAEDPTSFTIARSTLRVVATTFADAQSLNANMSLGVCNEPAVAAGASLVAQDRKCRAGDVDALGRQRQSHAVAKRRACRCPVVWQVTVVGPSTGPDGAQLQPNDVVPVNRSFAPMASVTMIGVLGVYAASVLARFDTTMVDVIVAPAATGFGDFDFEIARSAYGSTIV